MTLLDRYRATVDKHNILPADSFLAEQWRCNEVTPARMRSKLKAEGYAFAKRNGVWHVTARPGQKGKAAPSANGHSAAQQLAIQVVPADTPAPVQLLQAPAPVDDNAIAAQLALIYQELAKLNGLLAAHFQSQERSFQWPEEPASVW